MPRPRFAKLSPEKRASILRAATHEFAAHGFEGASYNRIIEKTGISKGAMYYYFDDKADLYATVLEGVQVRFLEEFAGLTAAIATADEFWAAMREIYARALRMGREEPEVIGLIRTMPQAQASGAGQAVHRLLQQQREWTAQLLRQGQEVAAVRTDLPFDLLVGLVMALDHAGDVWFSEHWDELGGGELERLAEMFLLLFQQMVSTPGASPSAPSDIEPGSGSRPPAAMPKE